MKKILSMLLVLGMILSLVGCGEKNSNEPDASANVEKKTFQVKFSTQSVPNDAHTKAIEVFKEEIEKSTDGQVQVEVFHSGSLFKQEEEMPAMMKGTLDMAYTSPAWLSEYVPSLSMFTAGYMFKDYNQMTEVYNGEIGTEIFDKVAKETGVRPLGAFYLGARQINLRDIGIEVNKPEDLEGVKLRMPNSPAWLFLGEALGANPTPLSFTELYMALKTGTVDGQDNPLPTDKNAKFYEVTKSIVLTNHYIDSIWPTINEDVWNEMGVELQGKIYEALGKAQKVCDETNLKAESELVEFFKGEGMTVTEPDVEAFSAHVQEAYLNNKEMTSSWDMDLYEKIQNLAK